MSTPGAGRKDGYVRSKPQPMFQQRHYEAIAKVLAVVDSGSPDPYLSDARAALAQLFEQDNPRFDRGRFDRASQAP